LQAGGRQAVIIIYHRNLSQITVITVKRRMSAMKTLKLLFAITFIVLLMVSISSPAKEPKSYYRYNHRVTYIDQTVATAYNSLESQTDSSPWITASGSRCRKGVIAANHLPFGTKVMIEGFGDQIFVVEDRMNRRYKKRIDIWMRSYRDAIKFGKREIRYYVIES
jgi:3D (Asp-Asp-Asp) domain-containing protein